MLTCPMSQCPKELQLHYNEIEGGDDEMKPQVVSENIYKLVEGAMMKWDELGSEDEELVDAAWTFFRCVGDLSWFGRELADYLAAADEMLQSLSQIERALKKSEDKAFREFVYPVLLMACSSALAGLGSLLTEKRLEMKRLKASPETPPE